MGNAHPSSAPYELFETADGDLVLAVGNDRQFEALCGVLGVSKLALDPRFIDNQARVRHRRELRTELGRALPRRSAAEWSEALVAARVPAGVVNDIAGAFALADALGLAPTVELQRNTGEVVRLTRSPIGLSANPPVYRTAPPEMPVRD